MQKSSFLRVCALTAASCAMAVALTGCTMQEVKDFLFAPRETASASQTAESAASSEEEEEVTYNEITPEVQSQIDALYAQLQSLQSQAESDVSAAVSSAEAAARADWAALPASERTTLKKISIIMDHTGELSSIQSQYDSQVSAIVDEMRSILSANGCSTDQADAAWAEYQSAKSSMISSLRSQAGI